ncbi:unnamed protein product, partial [Rotaria sp. Silwood2]
EATILSARSDDSDRELAVVKKKFPFLHQKFNIDSIYGSYSLESLDIGARSFTLVKNGRTVVIVRKKFFALSDIYGVEIVGDEDQAFILAVVIVIDQVLYDKKN